MLTLLLIAMQTRLAFDQIQGMTEPKEKSRVTLEQTTKLNVAQLPLGCRADMVEFTVCAEPLLPDQCIDSGERVWEPIVICVAPGTYTPRPLP